MCIKKSCCRKSKNAFKISRRKSKKVENGNGNVNENPGKKSKWDILDSVFVVGTIVDNNIVGVLEKVVVIREIAIVTGIKTRKMRSSETKNERNLHLSHHLSPESEICRIVR